MHEHRADVHVLAFDGPLRAPGFGRPPRRGDDAPSRRLARPAPRRASRNSRRRRCRFPCRSSQILPRLSPFLRPVEEPGRQKMNLTVKQNDFCEAEPLSSILHIEDRKPRRQSLDCLHEENWTSLFRRVADEAIRRRLTASETRLKLPDRPVASPARESRSTARLAGERRRREDRRYPAVPLCGESSGRSGHHRSLVNRNRRLWEHGDV